MAFKDLYENIFKNKILLVLNDFCPYPVVKVILALFSILLCVCFILMFSHFFVFKDTGSRTLCYPPDPSLAVAESRLSPQRSVPPSLPSDRRGAPSPDSQRCRRGSQIPSCGFQVGLFTKELN